MGHAKPLISLDNPTDQVAIFNEIVFNDMSVRQTEQRVRDILAPKVAAPKKDTAPKDKNHIFLKDIQDKMENRFGNKVAVAQDNEGKGEIKVSFSSTDDLNRILEIMSII
jgi:ParB family transcriptional regulator, chromosome partitioning protein